MITSMSWSFFPGTQLRIAPVCCKIIEMEITVAFNDAAFWHGISKNEITLGPMAPAGLASMKKALGV